MSKSLRTDFSRPPRETVELLRGIPSTNVNDCLGRWGGTDSALRPLNRAPLLGTAFTVALADKAHMAAADFFGIASGNTMTDKFERSGLTARK
ncbi:MAG: hypothetical protein II965_04290, partial [Pyramidobacter sp.]|nr:hypothetical protein [Pyramidobacter sp.]